ncbi:[Fe-Fe] hydrogenase large subunit C-terminal domain-containing protein [Brockia lithotrophica]|uniref:Ferredoxin hydrogenase large subunit n=1 Tax=Brockia lithotrophica TaxID=933949 RepID=A0A660LA59_9BACL|nr:[Fe-Fe] hydrogenase large subunit C-terminal domain-containing protein [Brockia lithotrophica]RKQ88450.1 ferredoxin hydrogenase large subunit [Brockia lithotrophica]
MSTMKVRTFPASEPLKQATGTYRKGELRGIIHINPDRCVGCDTCRKVCPADAISGEIGVTHKIDVDRCINCGQCLTNCPFGAIEQMSQLELVEKKLKDGKTTVVGIPAPAVRVAIAEEFGQPPGTLTVGQLHAALKKAGFKIYDNNYAADQTILEEGTELVGRILYNIFGLKKVTLKLWGKEFTLNLEELKPGPLPQFTSCCPAWVRFAELYYPDILPHLSSARSPLLMAGPTAKTYGALKVWKVDPRDVFTVGIMPCTAKIFEASRPEFTAAQHYLEEKGIIPHGTEMRDVDAVITTRELAQLFRDFGIDLLSMPKDSEDKPQEFEQYSGGATIFGVSGGVMEAAVRFAFAVLSGQEPSAVDKTWDFEAVRGYTNAVAAATIRVPLAPEFQKALGADHFDLKVATVNGIGTHASHLKPILREVAEGKSEFHFIEVMTCPGGCINGGGQPVNPMGTSWIDPLLPLVRV